MDSIKNENMAMMNMKENIQLNEFEIEPCETEDFEINPDADDSIVDVSEEEYDEVIREQRRKEDKKERKLAILRILLNIVVSLFVMWIVWFFCK